MTHSSAKVHYLYTLYVYIYINSTVRKLLILKCMGKIALQLKLQQESEIVGN